MSTSKKPTSMSLADKKREEVANKTYMVERLLKRRKRKVCFDILEKKREKTVTFSFFKGQNRIFSQMETLGSKSQFLGARRKYSRPNFNRFV